MRVRDNSSRTTFDADELYSRSQQDADITGGRNARAGSWRMGRQGHQAPPGRAGTGKAGPVITAARLGREAGDAGQR